MQNSLDVEFMTCFLGVKSHVNISCIPNGVVFPLQVTISKCLILGGSESAMILSRDVSSHENPRIKEYKAACHVSVTWNLFCKSYIICIGGTGL